MSSLTTTNIGLPQRDTLKKLAKKNGVSQVDFINACIEYFSKSGVSPLEPYLSPSEEIKKLTKRVDQVVRFMRTHEEKKLDPILNDMIILERRLGDMIGQSLSRKDYHKAYVELGEKLSGVINSLREGVNKQLQFSINRKKIEDQERKNTEEKLEKLSIVVMAISLLIMNRGTVSYRKEDMEHCQQIIEKYGSY